MRNERGPGPAGRGQNGLSEPPYSDQPEEWLKERLRQTYDDIASEPVPEPLLDLLRQLGEKEGRQS